MAIGGVSIRRAAPGCQGGLWDCATTSLPPKRQAAIRGAGLDEEDKSSLSHREDGPARQDGQCRRRWKDSGSPRAAASCHAPPSLRRCSEACQGEGSWRTRADCGLPPRPSRRSPLLGPGLGVLTWSSVELENLLPQHRCAQPRPQGSPEDGQDGEALMEKRGLAR